MWNSLGRGLGLMLALLALTGGCSTPNSSSPPEVTPPLSLRAEVLPPSAPADGQSRMVVFVELRRGDDAVPDSTQIILLHSIGTLGRGTLYTQAGTALDTLTTDTVAASGWLIACAEGLRDTAAITFLPASR